MIYILLLKYFSTIKTYLFILHLNYILIKHDVQQAEWDILTFEKFSKLVQPSWKYFVYCALIMFIGFLADLISANYALWSVTRLYPRTRFARIQISAVCFVSSEIRARWVRAEGRNVFRVHGKMYRRYLFRGIRPLPRVSASPDHMWRADSPTADCLRC